MEKFPNWKPYRSAYAYVSLFFQTLTVASARDQNSLLTLFLVDTRQYDRSITDLYWNTEYIQAISNDAARSLMGGRQENWFYKSLIDSKKRSAAWRIIGSQIGLSSADKGSWSFANVPLVFSQINISSAFGNENTFK